VVFSRIQWISGFKITSVKQVHVLRHVFVQVWSLDLAAKGVGEQQFATVGIFGFQIVVIKLVRYQFGNFKNAKTYGNWFIQGDMLACSANKREIIVDDLGTAKSRPAHRLRQFIGVADEANVNTMPHLLPGLAKSCICLQFCQIRLEFVQGHFSAFGAIVNPWLLPRFLIKRNNSVNFGQNKIVYDVKLKISVMVNVFGFL